jgi:hypothetical protein
MAEEPTVWMCSVTVMRPPERPQKREPTSVSAGQHIVVHPGGIESPTPSLLRMRQSRWSFES